MSCGNLETNITKTIFKCLHKLKIPLEKETKSIGIVGWFVRSFVRSVGRSVGRSVVRSFVLSFNIGIVLSFIRLF